MSARCSSQSAPAAEPSGVALRAQHFELVAREEQNGSADELQQLILLVYVDRPLETLGHLVERVMRQTQLVPDAVPLSDKGVKQLRGVTAAVFKGRDPSEGIARLVCDRGKPTRWRSCRGHRPSALR